MKEYYEWCLIDGTVLYGTAALQHMEYLMNNYKDLIDDISHTLNRCQKINHIVEEKTFPNTVMFTSEQINLVRVELELLLQRIDAGMED